VVSLGPDPDERLGTALAWVGDAPMMGGVSTTSIRLRPRSATELLATLEAGADLDDDETVDVLAHSLQCAAILEAVAPGDRELQVAGLVHDLGTILAPRRPETHARVGAATVSGLLGPRVARLVGLHDQAKRYLVTTDPGYRHQLSRRSIETLRLQGGLLDPEERAALDAEPELASCLALRRADDGAKQAGAVVPDLGHWAGVLDRLVRSAA
jgi:predicted HD phosphohydrolase